MTLVILLLVLATTVYFLQHGNCAARRWPAGRDVEDRDADRVRLELRARC